MTNVPLAPSAPRTRPVLVQLWLAAAERDVPGPLEHYCWQFLHPEETETAQRYRVASARHQHVIGRGMARVLLAGQTHDPNEICFRQLDQGKPIVERPIEVRRPFNIAHTPGLVVCGMADAEAGDPWLGVDVEAVDRRTDPALAHRYFSSLEIAQIEATRTLAAKRQLFLRIWTLKEAFIKAIGTGLRTPLDQFGFDDAASDDPQLIFLNPDLHHDRRWTCRSLEPRPGFIAAVAWGDRPPTTPMPASDVTVQLNDFAPATKPPPDH